MNRHLLLFGILLSLAACRPDDDTGTPVEPPVEAFRIDLSNTERIPATPQRSGDAAAGREYLIYGDYVDAGIPYSLFLTAFGETVDNRLGRTGKAATLPYQFNFVTDPNGVEMAVPTCLECHAQVFDGELIVGLGNTLSDYTEDQSGNLGLLDAAVALTYGGDSDERAAWKRFQRSAEVLGPQLITSTRGVNTADKLTAILGAHRDPQTLQWLDSPNYQVPVEVVPTDVPAWWNYKKKHAEFYNGSGRGDHARISMASSLLTIEDTTKAAEIDARMPDLMAYLASLEPPAFPQAVDEVLAARGEEVFRAQCTPCHGTYGAQETYPNLLVDLPTIGTDPLLTQYNFGYSEFIDWYNGSWFAQGPFAAYFAFETPGYVAPPLDGVWITAPYLHNGSVPTLAALLDSSLRPTYWERRFGQVEYDYEQVGYVYETATQGGRPEVYDTTVPGYGNQGHYYGDALTEEDRTAVLEYLKTL